MIRVILLLFFIFSSLSLFSQARNTTRQTPKKQDRYIDLEGLDVQGIIDRPGTLYILKMSKIEFEETIKKYDYLKEIIDATYKEPF